jgi:SAM-dependent methyltransferase
LSSVFDRSIRKFVPSLAKLSYNPAFKLLLDAPDLVANIFFPQFRGLPPNHLRVRIGVGNNLFNNQPWYFIGAKDFWFFALNRSLVNFDSTIVDIGCGCGRFAWHFRDYDYNGLRFRGKYIGIDIDKEMLDWCRRHFDSERFGFHQTTHASKVYNESGSGLSYILPIASDSVDFVFSTSLFTHLLDAEILNYMSESFRVLKPDAVMAMNCFLIDYPPNTFGYRHTFRHRLGNAYVESLKLPEAAVAFESRYLFDLAAKIGFRSSEIVTAPGVGQPLLVCRK